MLASTKRLESLMFVCFCFVEKHEAHVAHFLELRRITELQNCKLTRLQLCSRFCYLEIPKLQPAFFAGHSKTLVPCTVANNGKNTISMQSYITVFSDIGTLVCCLRRSVVF
jgi:hypothetical protein